MDVVGTRRAPPFERWEYGEYGTFILRGRECEIYLSPRPTYCDRGSWIAHLDARGALARDMDGADLWPRYYFDLDRAFLECEAWVKKRGQWTLDPK